VESVRCNARIVHRIRLGAETFQSQQEQGAPDVTSVLDRHRPRDGRLAHDISLCCGLETCKSTPMRVMSCSDLPTWHRDQILPLCGASLHAVGCAPRHSLLPDILTISCMHDDLFHRPADGHSNYRPTYAHSLVTRCLACRFANTVGAAPSRILSCHGGIAAARGRHCGGGAA
jgi:hypothetical protein